MSNAAALRKCFADLSEVGVELARVAPTIQGAAAAEIDAARTDVAATQFHIAVALRMGIDPVIESAAAQGARA